jgi:hypothetical protein
MEIEILSLKPCLNKVFRIEILHTCRIHLQQYPDFLDFLKLKNLFFKIFKKTSSKESFRHYYDFFLLLVVIVSYYGIGAPTLAFSPLCSRKLGRLRFVILIKLFTRPTT